MSKQVSPIIFISLFIFIDGIVLSIGAIFAGIGWWMLLISVIIFILLLYFSYKNNKNIKETDEYNKWVASRMNEINTKQLEIENELGKCDKEIEQNGLHLRIYEKAKIIFVDNRRFGFDEIVDCKIEDVKRDEYTQILDSYQQTTTTTYTSKANTKSVIGRTIAGSVIGGPVGAVIGGVTSKRTITPTSIQTENKPIYKTKKYTTTYYRLVITTSEEKSNKYYTKETKDKKSLEQIEDCIIQNVIKRLNTKYET